jgi:cytochrome P450
MNLTTTSAQRRPQDDRAPMLPGAGVLGHLQLFRHDPLELMMAAMRTDDLVRVRIGPQVVHFAFDPGDIKHVLVERHAHYSKQTRGYQALRRFLGQGLVTSEGDFWRRQRRIAQPAFHHRRLARLASSMRAASEDLAADWSRAAAAGETVDVAASMMQVTLRIAGESLFSVDLSSDSARIGSAVSDMLAGFDVVFRSPLPFIEHLPTPTMRRARRAMDLLENTVGGIIAQRRGGQADDDLLQMLMEARDEETGESMSDRQLRDEVLTMLTAGHETTANALTFTLYLLSKHPDVARRVRTELDEVLGDRPVDVTDLRALVYTEQVLQEAMRLYPPVWAIARRAEQSDRLSGYAVERGAWVVMSPYATHRHPRYWDNPEGFDPERFSERARAAGRAAGRSRYAYFPFAAGPRKCIGDHFARMEALIVLATVLRTAQPALLAGHQLELEPSVTLRPRGGLPMQLER